MSLFDDLVSINNSLSATLQGINSLLPFEAETLKDAPPIIEVAIGSARQEGEESGYDIGYDVGYGNAASIIVSTSNEVIEKYTTPVEDWADLPEKIEEVYDVGFANGQAEGGGGGYDEGFKDGQLALLEDSKYMRGSATGELVSLKDVSPVEHTVGVVVGSKNLANKDAFVDYPSVRKYLPIELDAGTYYYSSNMHSASGVTFYTGIVVDGSVATENNVAVFSGFAGTQDTGTFTIAESGTYRFLIYCSNADIRAALENAWGSVWIQIERGTVATSYTPYINELSNVKVLAMGKNILPFPYKDTTKTLNGITWTVNADGTITANGTASGDSVFQLTDTYIYNNGLHCRISGCPTGGSADTYYLYSVMTGHKDVGSGTGVTITDSRYWKFRIYIKNGYTANNLVFKPQIELGTTATEYEPYKGAEYEQGEPIASISPNMTITTDTGGTTVSVEYLRDIDLYIDSLITGVALSGGE